MEVKDKESAHSGGEKGGVMGKGTKSCGANVSRDCALKIFTTQHAGRDLFSLSF